MTVIYVDTLFLLNGIIDYLLLLAAARLAGEPLRRLRFGAAAALGGAYAVAGKERGPLTEPMFYVLMSFLRRDMCGTEITEFVERRTRGRVRLGPGTLYTLLAKFQDEGFIQETEVDGRKRTYRLTDQGRQAYHEELDRLRACVLDGEEEER